MTDSLAECLHAADIAIVATPWPELSELPSAVSGRRGPPMVVIDCWRLLDPGETDPNTSSSTLLEAVAARLQPAEPRADPP